MTTNTTNPLWRELNEKRTIGNVAQCENDDNGNIVARFDDGRIMANFEIDRYKLDDAEIKANAQYTALAVNNLARIAEALTRIREASVQGLEMYANGEKFSFETLAGFVAEISGEALAAIS